MFAIPEVGVVVVALALLLFALAGLAFVELERKLFDGAPFPLSWIITHLVGAQAAVLNRIKSWALAGISAAATFLLAVFDVPRRLFDDLVQALEGLPDLARSLRAHALSLYHAAVHYAALTADGIAANVILTTHYLEGRIAAGAIDLARDVTDIGRRIAIDVTALSRVIAGDVARVHAAIDAAVGALRHDVVAGIDGAVATARHDIAVAAGAIDGEIATVRRDFTGAIDAVKSDVVRQVGAAEATAAAGITAAVAGVLALIRSGVMATVATINAELDDCVRPNCSWMNSLGTELSALASGAEIALLVAFLVEAAADPGAVAASVEAVATPIADGVYGVLGPVISTLSNLTTDWFGKGNAA